jgi:hypothetical protein
MALTGKVGEAGWTVSVKTVRADGGGFCADVRVSHETGGCMFTHAFRSHVPCASERDALLEGLREGMVWIELKRSRTIRVSRGS